MAINAKFTRTLPSPTATISGGFVFLLSAGWFTDADQGVAGSPIDGGANSIANGGGDMQIFSDTSTTTRLPIEVVSFITGGSPEAQVWVRTPSYTAGDTITIGRDDTQTVQPLPSSTYGSESVWVDYNYVTHDGVTDSTGNNIITQFGSPTVGVNPWGGDSVVLNGSTQYGRTSLSLSVDNPTYYSLWYKAPALSTNPTLFGAYDSTSGSRFDVIRLVSDKLNFWRRNSNVSTTAAMQLIPSTASTWEKATGYNSASGNRNILLNGDDRAVNATAITQPTGFFDRISYGRSDDSTPSNYFEGELAELRVSPFAPSDSFELSEYSNQNDPDNFGTSSEWVLVGAGVSGAITQTAESFTQSSIGTVANPVFTGVIEQSTSAFTQSLSGNVAANVTGVIQQTLSSFTQSLLGTVTIPISGDINQEISGFTQSSVGSVPAQWVDKPPVSTVWTNQDGVSTIWTDKV